MGEYGYIEVERNPDGSLGEMARMTDLGIAIVELWKLGYEKSLAQRIIEAKFANAKSGWANTWHLKLWCKTVHWRLKIRHLFRIKDAV